MKRIKGILILVLLLALLASPAAILASDISAARYYGTVIISNHSTANTNVAVNCSISTQALIDGDYLNSSANNCAVMSGGGVDVAFQPSVNASYPWCFWVPSIGQNASTADILYTANSTGGKIRYFPAAGGMTSSDNANMELGDNFTVEQKGWVDTDNGTAKNLVNKEGAFRTFVSPTVSGNITSVLTTWVSPTGGVAGGWANVANAYDEDTVTFAFKNVAGAGDETYEATHAGVVSDQCQWWVSYTASLTNFKVEAYYGGAYHTVLEDATPTTGEWVSALYPDGIQIATKVKFTFTLDGAGGDVKVYETDFGSATQAITVTGVSSANHTVTTTMETPFWGMRVDEDVLLPVNDNLALNAPFWQVELSGSPFTSFDAYGHTCTVTGSTWHPTYRDFDGNDLIDCGADAVLKNLGVSANFTIEWWGYSDYNWGGLAERGLAGNRARNNPADAGVVIIVEDAVTGTLRVEISDGVTDEKLTWANELSPNVWEHLVLTYDEPTDTMELFINGVSQGTVTFSQKITASGNNWIVGNEPSGRFYVGRIGETRAYTRVLTDTEITNNYNTTKWLYDGTINKEVRSANGVLDNAKDWYYYQNLADYWHYTKITINSVLQQWIEWEYDTVFSDLSGHSPAHDAIPTFRTTSSDPDVSAVLSSFLPITEAKAPSYALEEAPPFIETVPTIVSEWDVVPPAGTFPLAGVIRAIAGATATPPQLPLLVIAAFVILAFSLTFSWMMRKYGSGSLIIKSLVIIAIMGVFVALKNFGIDFWMLFVFAVIATALCMASRHSTWN